MINMCEFHGRWRRLLHQALSEKEVLKDKLQAMGGDGKCLVINHQVGSDWHLEHFSEDQVLGRQRSGIDFGWRGSHTLHSCLEGCSKCFPSQTGLREWLGMCSHVAAMYAMYAMCS